MSKIVPWKETTKDRDKAALSKTLSKTLRIHIFCSSYRTKRTRRNWRAGENGVVAECRGLRFAPTTKIERFAKISLSLDFSILPSATTPHKIHTIHKNPHTTNPP